MSSTGDAIVEGLVGLLRRLFDSEEEGGIASLHVGGLRPSGHNQLLDTSLLSGAEEDLSAKGGRYLA